MSLYNKASLVMIPSGYKSGKVYSQKPTDGSGDLSFTRASDGTRINSAGLVEVMPWNLVQYSEDFNNGVWSKYQASVTANTTTAPNGTLTADTLQDNAANDSHITYQTPNITAGTYTISVYAKASTLSNINLVLFDGVSTSYGSNRFDLSNGTTTGANQSIENVGNGWYRCSFTLTTTLSGVQYVYVFLNNGTSSVYTGTGSGAVFIWGYQLNIGSTAKPYFPTTDRLNVPRLTYQNGGGGCPSLLLEKQSTNLMLWSEQFDNAVYTKRNSTISANAIISPDGTTNADKIQEDTSNDRHDIYQGFTCTSGVTYTQTIFAKQGERRYCFMSFGTSLLNPGDTFFDLQDGVVVSTPSGVTSAIQNMGNGWYRCSITTTCSGDGTGYYVNGPAITSSNYIYQGVSGYGIYVWGCQIEASSYATSLINTTSASATRVADACSKTGISSLIGQTEGTIFADVTLTTRQSFSYISISNGGSSANYIGVYFRAAAIELEVVNGGVLQGNVAYSNSSTGRFKVAIGYKENDFVLYINGTQIGIDTSGTLPTCNYLDLFGFGQEQPFQISQTLLFKTRLTNAELASLTTL